ncbi:MAG: hypothetical protein LBH11_06140, partial [Propionibacteriaceae bacterium]|nr:hypothetical protein [Propionibacteriaceae bacterium]
MTAADYSSYRATEDPVTNNLASATDISACGRQPVENQRPQLTANVSLSEHMFEQLCNTPIRNAPLLSDVSTPAPALP